METGIRRCVKELSYEAQALTGLHQEDTILQCRITQDGKTYFVPDEELPVVLPELEDYKGKDGKAPLENATEWKQYHQNGIQGTRETSTMPGSAGSSWYYMRYIDPQNDKEFCNQELLKHWMPM